MLIKICYVVIRNETEFNNKNRNNMRSEYMTDMLKVHLGINKWHCEDEDLSYEEVESMALDGMKRAIRMFERDDYMHCKDDALERLSLLVQELCAYRSEVAEREYDRRHSY